MNDRKHTIFAKIREKFREEKAAVGIIYALAAVPAFALAGGVMDYMNVTKEREALQAALDAGTLAALNLSNFNDVEARKVILKYLKGNYYISSSTQLDFNALTVHTEEIRDRTGVKKKVDAVLPAKVKTPFMNILGLSNFSFTVKSQAKRGIGGLEVVLVLDNTGSMRFSSPTGGSKMNELKIAANELIDTLKRVADRPHVKHVKVGIVPFSSHVMIGKWAWRKSWLDHNDVPSKSAWDGALGVRNPDDDLDIIDGDYDDHPVPAVTSGVYQRIVGRWIYIHKGKNRMPVTMLGLQDVKTRINSLKNKINEMHPDGWTYIPGGLAWGWRVLSKKKPYVRGTSYSYARNKGIKKVIVLMTDGENTCDYHENGYLRCDNYISGRQADQRLKRLCENIKNEGIGIITIAFAVRHRETREMLRECSNMGYYTPETGQLVQTFEEIGRKLTALHLSK